MRKVFVLLGIMGLLSCDNKTDETSEDGNSITNITEIGDSDTEDDTSDNEMENSKYIDNSLSTGDTPYAEYYGSNKECKYDDCSQIKVVTSDSDVLVTIKKDEKVVSHAYIGKNDNYTFSVPNGRYQVFFYYGRGWDPEKPMKNGEMKGGFVADEAFQKDEPLDLNNNKLEYKLVLQQNGNFKTQSSDPSEAL